MSSRCACVIDCGTTSIRARVVEILGSAVRVLDDFSKPLDLTDAFQGGAFPRPIMDAVVSAVQDILQVAAGYGVQIEDVRAVATSAMREAVNADAVVERVLQSTGIELEVIDSAEEARLYFEALTHLWSEHGGGLPNEAILMMDVGSGATVTSLVNGGKLVHSVDEHFGTIRVFEQFQGLHDHADFASTVDRFTHGAVRMMLRRLPRETVARLVVTGGEMRQLARLIDPSASGPQPELSGEQLDAWYEEIRECSAPARARRLACGSDEAARLIMVGCLLRHLMDETGLDRVQVPTMRLRDGLVADLLPGSLGRRHLDRVQVLAMGRMFAERYGMELAYAENTASLATQLFDQLAQLHHLGERERVLLEFSAMVHDIGAYINVRNRHKHSMYLIQSLDLPGLDPDEIAVVAQVVRYHRRAAPRPNHHEFQALPRESRVRITMLAALLRLAYGLDVERTQRVRKIHCTISGGRLLITLDRRQIALERWSISGKSQMLEDVFGLEVVLKPRQED